MTHGTIDGPNPPLMSCFPEMFILVRHDFHSDGEPGIMDPLRRNISMTILSSTGDLNSSWCYVWGSHDFVSVRWSSPLHRRKLFVKDIPTTEDYIYVVDWYPVDYW